MKSHDLYYLARPLIPLRPQIAVRRSVAARKRRTAGAFWPIDPGARAAPPDWRGWPGRKKSALVLNHDVDTVRGHDRCERLAELEKTPGVRSAFFFVPEGYLTSPELRRRLSEEGFEAGVRGLLHDGKMFVSRRIFGKRARRVDLPTFFRPPP